MTHLQTISNRSSKRCRIIRYVFCFVLFFLIPYTTSSAMDFVQVSEDKSNFVLETENTQFIPWGFNYDHDENNRLIEDYWEKEWQKIEEDFMEMKDLGANVVRIHLQLGKFMKQHDKINTFAFYKLALLVKLAERSGLYLDITGLGCYHKKDVPIWYDGLSEEERWDVQAQFWEAVAKTCANSPAIFCYNLMNEPVLPGNNKKETEWLLGNFGGKYFVQRISLDLKGRSRQQVAKEWIEHLVTAIRKHDNHHLITVGVIPWAHVFPKAKPFFYSKEVGKSLDFVSVHFYPKSGEIQKALTALKVYDIGKPLVIEEIFPLNCTLDELRSFIISSKDSVDGWISFYWGKKVEDYSNSDGISGDIIKNWLTLFKKMSHEIDCRVLLSKAFF